MNLKFVYDKEADVLYATIGEPKPGIFEEPEDGILIRLDKRTRKPIGFTILNYKRQKRDGHLKTIPYFPHVQLPAIETA